MTKKTSGAGATATKKVAALVAALVNCAAVPIADDNIMQKSQQGNSDALINNNMIMIISGKSFQ